MSDWGKSSQYAGRLPTRLDLRFQHPVEGTLPLAHAACLQQSEDEVGHLLLVATACVEALPLRHLSVQLLKESPDRR